MSDARNDALRWVQRFHDVVDGLAASVADANAGKLACRAGCAGCCTDDLTVFEIEAELIRERHPTLLSEGTAGAVGACAFLDGGGRCRIYPDRPYVCRTQGLPLRWVEVDEEGPVEMRDVCPESAASVDLEDLGNGALWALGPFEAKLAEQQASAPGGEAARIPLRALFHETAAASGKTKLPVVR